jgi:hypothetical protein
VEGAMVGTSIPGLITADKVLNCKCQTLWIRGTWCHLLLCAIIWLRWPRSNFMDSTLWDF